MIKGVQQWPKNEECFRTELQIQKGLVFGYCQSHVPVQTAVHLPSHCFPAIQENYTTNTLQYWEYFLPPVHTSIGK